MSGFQDVEIFVLEIKTEILRKRCIFLQCMQHDYEFNTFCSYLRPSFVEHKDFTAHRNSLYNKIYYYSTINNIYLDTLIAPTTVVVSAVL